MSGEIKHSWNGSILTITSDSGTSSADLKGPQGDTGIRGAQGAAGLILDVNGVLHLENYVTKAELEQVTVNTVSLDFTGWDSGYFTEVLADGTVLNHEVLYDDAGNIISIGGIELRGL